jgi:hypothetical protein
VVLRGIYKFINKGVIQSCKSMINALSDIPIYNLNNDIPSNSIFTDIIKDTFKEVGKEPTIELLEIYLTGMKKELEIIEKKDAGLHYLDEDGAVAAQNRYLNHDNQRSSYLLPHFNKKIAQIFDDNNDGKINDGEELERIMHSLKNFIYKESIRNKFKDERFYSDYDKNIELIEYNVKNPNNQKER